MVSPTMLAVAAMVFWGIWAFLVGLATESISPITALITVSLARLALGSGYAIHTGEPLLPSGETATMYIVAAGVFGTIASILYYTSVDLGKTSVATAITALYFLVTVVLGVVVLGEEITMTKLLGFIFAAIAVVLLTQ